MKRYKIILDDIKTGKIMPSNSLVEMCAVLLYVTEHIDETREYCDWMAGKQEITGFYESVQKSLHLITDMNEPVSNEKISILLKKHRDGILDHHFWNDVDVEWAHGSTGYYGDSYGDDILIKLIALSKGKINAGIL